MMVSLSPYIPSRYTLRVLVLKTSHCFATIGQGLSSLAAFHGAPLQAPQAPL